MDYRRSVYKAPLLISAMAASAVWAQGSWQSTLAAPIWVEVQVQRGDTLIGLLREGTDWRPVQRDNGIADPKRLRPGSILRIPAPLLREQPAVAEVVHAHGDVTVTRAATLTPLSLEGGATLSAGDVVRTGSQSSATLRFADGERVLVRPASEFRIQRLEPSRGGAEATVPPAAPASAPSRPEGKTPQTSLDMRGRGLRTAAAGATSRLP